MEFEILPLWNSNAAATGWARGATETVAHREPFFGCWRRFDHDLCHPSSIQVVKSSVKTSGEARGIVRKRDPNRVGGVVSLEILRTDAMNHAEPLGFGDFSSPICWIDRDPQSSAGRVMTRREAGGADQRRGGIRQFKFGDHLTQGGWVKRARTKQPRTWSREIQHGGFNSLNTRAAVEDERNSLETSPRDMLGTSGRQSFRTIGARGGQRDATRLKQGTRHWMRGSA